MVCSCVPLLSYRVWWCVSPHDHVQSVSFPVRAARQEGVEYRVQQVRVAVVLASRRCLATGRKVPGRLARVGLGRSLQRTSEYPPASPTVCAWQVSSMSVIIVGSVSHFSHTHTSLVCMVCPWSSALGRSPRLTGMECVVGAVYVYLFHRHMVI